MARQPQMRRSAEFDLIAELRARLPAPPSARHVVGIGDDAAVTDPGGVTAISVDATVEGVHFRSRWCPPRSVGAKAMATALSDLAAMGAEPGEAFVWLGRPGWLDDEGALELCDGLAGVAAAAGVAILGGDLTRAPELAVSVTVVGHAGGPDELVGRDGAEPGQIVCLTGELGGAAAGLELLERPDLAAGIEPDQADGARARQLAPSARLEAGRRLAAAGARAMIDLSDGLAADAAQIAAASGVGLEIELEQVPVAPGVAEIAAAAGRDRHELMLAGEDYELLCALPEGRLEGAAAAVAEAGSGLVEIGRIVAEPGVRLRTSAGRLARDPEGEPGS